MNTIKTPHELARNLQLNLDKPKMGKCKDCGGGGKRMLPDHYTWTHYTVVTCHRCGGAGEVPKVWV